MNGSNSLPVVFYRIHVRGKAQKTNVREEAEKLENDNGAEKGTCTTLVTRIPAIFSSPIKKIEGQIRNLFYKDAITIGDEYGVPIVVLPAFKSRLDKLVQQYELYFSKLVEAAESGELERIIRKQTANLVDYIKIPTVAEIRNGYGVDVYCHVNYESKEVEQAMSILADDIRDQVKADVEETLRKEKAVADAAGNEKVKEEMKEFIAVVNERLTCKDEDAKGKQFKTIVDRAIRIATVLPAYNITNDPEVSKMLAEFRKQFDGMDKEVLKTSGDARQNVVTKANDLAKSFASLL